VPTACDFDVRQPTCCFDVEVFLSRRLHVPDTRRLWSAHGGRESTFAAITSKHLLRFLTTIVSKMMNHCTGTIQIREESGSGMRKWEKIWFKTTAENRERERWQQWRAMEECSTHERLQTGNANLISENVNQITVVYFLLVRFNMHVFTPKCTKLPRYCPLYFQKFYGGDVDGPP